MHGGYDSENAWNLFIDLPVSNKKMATTKVPKLEHVQKHSQSRHL